MLGNIMSRWNKMSIMRGFHVRIVILLAAIVLLVVVSSADDQPPAGGESETAGVSEQGVDSHIATVTKEVIPPEETSDRQEKQPPNSLLLAHDEQMAFINRTVLHYFIIQYIAVFMAVLLGFAGIALIIYGWRVKPDENIALSIGVLKVNGASAGIVALALAVWLLQSIAINGLEVTGGTIK